MGQEMYRICALMSGQDPRDFVLFALGGAGPVHATGYADGTDVSRVATFPFSSVFGAFSTLAMDVLQTYEKTVNLNLFSHKDGSYAVDSIERFNREASQLMEFGRRDMEEEGFDFNTVRLELEVHMCYGQQRQTLPVKVAQFPLKGAPDIKALCDGFNSAYASKFGEGACYPEAGIEMVEMRLNAVGNAEKYTPSKIAQDKDPNASRVGSRKAFWGPEHGFVETPIYRRETLGGGVTIEGPVICEAIDTVIVTPPGWRFRTDDWGIGWIERK
jgi:N-methylhydantoinase A/acetophenone carboxylase